MKHILDLTPGAVASLACSLEVAAPKVGNVHRSADFDKGVLEDFLVSGILLGQTIDSMEDRSVGETILQVIKHTKNLVGHNTNLGLALLLVPLAKATSTINNDSANASERLSELRGALEKLLENLTIADSVAIYRAIDLANPAGLDRVERGDVKTELENAQPMPLIEAMALAAERDLIARQYTNNFQQVFVDGLVLLQHSLLRFPQLPRAIVHLHLALIGRFGDSLIERKSGKQINLQAQEWAISICDQIESKMNQAPDSWAEIDALISPINFWLRADGNRRNPGTTADMVGAILYVAIATGSLKPPFR